MALMFTKRQDPVEKWGTRQLTTSNAIGPAVEGAKQSWLPKSKQDAILKSLPPEAWTYLGSGYSASDWMPMKWLVDLADTSRRELGRTDFLRHWAYGSQRVFEAPLMAGALKMVRTLTAMGLPAGKAALKQAAPFMDLSARECGKFVFKDIAPDDKCRAAVELTEIPLVFLNSQGYREGFEVVLKVFIELAGGHSVRVGSELRAAQSTFAYDCSWK